MDANQIKTVLTKILSDHNVPPSAIATYTDEVVGDLTVPNLSGKEIIAILRDGTMVFAREQLQDQILAALNEIKEALATPSQAQHFNSNF